MAGPTPAASPSPGHAESRERVAYRTASPLKPADNRPLHPGQRHPTDRELEEALEDRLRGRSAFPIGLAWELTEERCAHWLTHTFQGLRGDSQLMRRLGPLEGDEMGDLIWDLLCYQSLDPRRRPPLHEYLKPGRERWGMLRELVDQLRAAGVIGDDGAAE